MNYRINDISDRMKTPEEEFEAKFEKTRGERNNRNGNSKNRKGGKE